MAIKISNTDVINNARKGILQSINPGSYTTGGEPGSPSPGDIIYNTTETEPQFWDGSKWQPLFNCAGGGGGCASPGCAGSFCISNDGIGEINYTPNRGNILESKSGHNTIVGNSTWTVPGSCNKKPNGISMEGAEGYIKGFSKISNIIFIAEPRQWVVDPSTGVPVPQCPSVTFEPFGVSRLYFDGVSEVDCCIFDFRQTSSYSIPGVAIQSEFYGGAALTEWSSDNKFQIAPQQGGGYCDIGDPSIKWEFNASPGLTSQSVDNILVQLVDAVGTHRFGSDLNSGGGTAHCSPGAGSQWIKIGGAAPSSTGKDAAAVLRAKGMTVSHS